MTFLPFVASADNSGKCGTSLTYTFIEASKTLTITGTGKMSNYSSRNNPWYEYRTEIQRIVINDGMTYIGNYAFDGCVNANSIEIPNSVTSFGQRVFSGCNSMTTVKIPSNMTSIGEWAFTNSGITTITIPNSVTSIESSAFNSCKSLTSIIIPNSVKTIGSAAFRECINLVSISLPNEITSIDLSTFSNCSSLETISIPSSVTKIGYSSFNGCSSLSSIEIPENVTTIDSYAFADCTSLLNISIPSKIQKIDWLAFKDCDKLESVIIYAESVPTTDKDAFKNTPISKAVLYVPPTSIEAYKEASPWNKFKHVIAIGSEPPVDKYKLEYKVDGSVYKSYEVEFGAIITPEEAPVKEGYTFSGWSEIPSTMPDHDVTVTGSFVKNNYDVEIDGIYYNLINKAKSAIVTKNNAKPYTGDLVIPETIQYEGKTFTVTEIKCISGIGGNNTLKSVVIPKSVTTIGEDCFRGCINIISLYIPNGVTTIGEYAFYGCTNLQSITLPSGISEIPAGMLQYCSSLEYIDIPSKVVTIGEYAFAYCKGLKGITIPNIFSIGASAFYRCNSLLSIDLPIVLLIGKDAFNYCENLGSIKLGKYIASIGSKAFANCKELADVYCYCDSVLSTNLISSDVFSGSQVNYATLHVIGSLVNQYKRTKPWSEFGNIVALTEEETHVNNVTNPQIVEQSRYTVSGLRIDKPQKGLNIIRMSDGRTRKVLVKSR